MQKHSCKCTPGLFGWLFGFRCCEHRHNTVTGKNPPPDRTRPVPPLGPGGGYQPVAGDQRPLNPPKKP